MARQDHACFGLSRAEPHHRIDRRRFVGTLGIAATAALVAGGLPLRPAASGAAEALLLSCMDYRLVDDLVRFMDGMGLRDRYDHVVLAGASLGVMSLAFPDWHETFWQHLDVAIDLHGIGKVIAVDHRDCGAYRIALSAEQVATPERELETHRAVLQDFAHAVKSRHPGLAVETYLMALDGSVEAV